MQKKRPDKGQASAAVRPLPATSVPQESGSRRSARRPGAGRTARAGTARPQRPSPLTLHANLSHTRFPFKDRNEKQHKPQSVALLRSHHSGGHRACGLWPHRACPALPGKPPRLNLLASEATRGSGLPAHPPRSAELTRLRTAPILRGVAAGSGAGALQPKTTMSDWSCQASDLLPKPRLSQGSW